MTAAPSDADFFDETDGAYEVVEPDPFDDLPTGRTSVATPDPGRTVRAVDHGLPAVMPLRRPSLRAEIGPTPAAGFGALVRPGLPSLTVPDGLAELLPNGLRRGSTMAVTSSVSLLLALIGTASARGAWTALVGMPTVSAEALTEAGVDLGRLAVISPPDAAWTSASFTTAVGALLDAVDIVIARPGGAGSAVTDGEARRLTARARSKDAVLVLFGQQATSWPAVELQLSAQHDHWDGIGDGYGRLRRRSITVSAAGRGRFGQGRSTRLWLPIPTGAAGAAVATGAAAPSVTGGLPARLSEAG